MNRGFTWTMLLGCAVLAGGCLSGAAVEEQSGGIQEWNEEEGWHEVDEPSEQVWSEEEGWHEVGGSSDAAEPERNCNGVASTRGSCTIISVVCDGDTWAKNTCYGACASEASVCDEIK